MEEKMNCIECGKRAPRGFALCDLCFKKVVSDLRRLLKEYKIIPDKGE